MPAIDHPYLPHNGVTYWLSGPRPQFARFVASVVLSSGNPMFVEFRRAMGFRVPVRDPLRYFPATFSQGAVQTWLDAYVDEERLNDRALIEWLLQLAYSDIDNSAVLVAVQGTCYAGPPRLWLGEEAPVTTPSDMRIAPCLRQPTSPVPGPQFARVRAILDASADTWYSGQYYATAGGLVWFPQLPLVSNRHTNDIRLQGFNRLDFDPIPLDVCSGSVFTRPNLMALAYQAGWVSPGTGDDDLCGDVLDEMGGVPEGAEWWGHPAIVRPRLHPAEALQRLGEHYRDWVETEGPVLTVSGRRVSFTSSRPPLQSHRRMVALPLP